jgi:STE24 endopeptidase
MDADWMYSAYHYSHPILTERLKAVGWTSETKVGDDDKKADDKKADEKKAEASVPEKEL